MECECVGSTPSVEVDLRVPVRIHSGAFVSTVAGLLRSDPGPGHPLFDEANELTNIIYREHVDNVKIDAELTLHRDHQAKQRNGSGAEVGKSAVTRDFKWSEYV